jgi:dolichyl-phosphate beta-glucosyltransferase
MPRPDSESPPELSVVVPVFDEELVLERSLGELTAFLTAFGRPFEVVCVDDGSRDASPRVLRDARARDPRIVVLTQEHNRGKGAAVRAGMLAARGELAVFMDADLSTPLEELRALVAALESGADVAIGNRRAAGAVITRRQPKLREWLGRGFTLVTRVLLVPGIEDFTCGFKGFRRAAARAVFERSTLDGWAFDAELLAIARAHGLRVAQVPVRWRHEDDSKVRLVRAVLGSSRDLARILARRLSGAYRPPRG